MSPSSQDYASLADHSYDRRGDMGNLVSSRAEEQIGGIWYRVLKHVDNPDNGYQGTVYQRADDGHIVVAHRGTEFDREPLRDGLTDAGMVLARHNVQIEDAIELTRWARAYAESPDTRREYGHAPEVTVTGHSLGGTLAQASAHHFDLRGETFNAYGAASLDRRIPEGGDRVLNHVMATDPVSAASPHYGQVRIYAQPEEISRLKSSGYHDNRLLDAVATDLPVVVAARSFGAHSMHNFLDVDGEGRPDVSMLRDPEARRLADQHGRIIDNYREDLEGIRRGITVASRGPAGLVQDGVDWFRGPVPAGEPAAREERDRGAAADGAHARLDRLMSGQVDPASREAWDREVALHRERAEPAHESVLGARQQAQEQQQMEMGR